ncbi:selenoprotein H [Drosophila grimshawi]|uniref:GH20859 n=1 Tax=Drosophila grimshawi TaxID=7222 RepID=B4J5G2_DROGR|nr:selenoprotein H [Drosophila grimshawi]EDW00725.1 GH20859 [Drosophila grimshawi]
MARNKKGKNVDWADDEHFSKDRSIFYIEHTTECPIFHTKAEECLTFFQQRIPERQFQLVRNRNGKQVPRDGAFEVCIAQNARTSQHELWSGLNRGPPRRDKFPLYEDLVADVHRVLRKFYPDKVAPEDDEEIGDL